MTKAIIQNDIIDVIYDTVCGYPIDEAIKIVEDYQQGKLIPIEWIKKWCGDEPYWSNCAMHLIEDWEKGNGK